MTTGNKNLADKRDNGLYPFYVRSQQIEKINTYSHDGEAVLIPGDGKIGEIFHYINGKFDFHQRVYALSECSESLKYIYYEFQKNLKKHLLSFSAKATVDSVRRPMLTKYGISLPYIKEQQKITHFFSLLDKQIELWETKLQLNELMRNYYLNNLFVDTKYFNQQPKLRFKEFDQNWDRKIVTEMSKSLKSGGTPKSDHSEYYNGTIPFLSISDMNTKYLVKTIKNICKMAINNSSAYILPKNNLILSIYASFGIPIINKIDVALPQSVLGFIFNQNYDNEFIYYLFLNSYRLFEKITETGSQPNISLKNIKKLLFMIPPHLNEQQKIAKFFSTIDWNIELCKSCISYLKKIKKYYLINLFI